MFSDSNRIISTHVGSLVRPDDFANLLRRRMEGNVQDNEYLPALQASVSQVVKDQVAAGIDVVSDGELDGGQDGGQI